MGTKVVTKKVRGSFVNVFRPRQSNFGGDDEYSLMIIVPKTDTETLGALNAAAKEAASGKWGDKLPRNMRNPIRDADAEAEANGEQPLEHLKGCCFLNVKSKNKPQVVDRQRYEITDPAEFKSGDYCRVSLNAYAYDVNGNRGVSFGLGNVQVVAKGEPLGGGSRARDDFDDWDEDDADGVDDWAA